MCVGGGAYLSICNTEIEADWQRERNRERERERERERAWSREIQTRTADEHVDSQAHR